MKWLLFCFLLVGCVSNAPFSDSQGAYSVHYEAGDISYSATIFKPTPCHELEVNEQILESFPEQLRVDVVVKKTDGFCIQVIDEETIEGTFELGHKPASFGININGENVYLVDFP